MPLRLCQRLPYVVPVNPALKKVGVFYTIRLIKTLNLVRFRRLAKLTKRVKIIIKRGDYNDKRRVSNGD